MSIIIKGMDMPKSCAECIFNDGHGYCWLVVDVECPLVEIVQCKECENFNPMTHGCNRSPSVEPWWEDDFCSYGERSEK